MTAATAEKIDPLDLLYVRSLHNGRPCSGWRNPIY